jgi:two-component system, sensor histidine kinase ChiS
MKQPRQLVLVAEDEPILRGLIVRQLELAGYKVRAAADGAAAWEALQQETDTAIVLLDLMMPLVTGYELLVRMRREERFRTLPVVVLSNSGQIDDLNRAFECGAHDVLIKANFNPDQLEDMVAKYLRAEKTPQAQ